MQQLGRMLLPAPAASPEESSALQPRSPPSYRRVEAGSSHNLLSSVDLSCEISVCGGVCVSPCWSVQVLFLSAQSIYMLT